MSFKMISEYSAEISQSSIKIVLATIEFFENKQNT